MSPESRARAEAKAKEMLKAMEDKRVEEAREKAKEEALGFIHQFPQPHPYMPPQVVEFVCKLLAAYREPLEKQIANHLVTLEDLESALDKCDAWRKEAESAKKRISKLEEALRRCKAIIDAMGGMANHYDGIRITRDIIERALKGEQAK